MQYTVYAMDVSSLGDPVDQTDIDIMNKFLDEEVRAAGLDERASVIVSENAGRYTFLPDWDEELNAAVERAWERFLNR